MVNEMISDDKKNEYIGFIKGQLNAKNNWLHYRNSFTDLESALRAYNIGAGEYAKLNSDEAFNLFYERCEGILNEDRNTWAPKGEAL